MEGLPQTPDTILQQLGGEQFMRMTGVSQLSYTEDSLQIKIGKNDKKVTHVTITLTPMDDYMFETFKVRGTKVTHLVTKTEVYCDQLVDMFEAHTGLYTHL